jgi:small subunit ribosomal protein S9
MVTKKTTEKKVETTSHKTKADSTKDTLKANFIRAVGRRKTSVARVRMFKDGKGVITVEGKDWKTYFPTLEQQFVVFSPLKATGQGESFDFSVKIAGGGIMSQAGALQHGIARTLLKFDEQFKAVLKKSGFLTRDPRVKERKKPGLKRARRAPQWKKR